MVSMNELHIEAEQHKLVTILQLAGTFTKATSKKLEPVLLSLLDARAPEFILIQCRQLTDFAAESYDLLQKFAALLNEQARELIICAVPSELLREELIFPPLTYYETQEQALSVFAETSQTAAAQAAILVISILAGPCSGTARLQPGDKELLIGRHSQCHLSLPEDIRTSRYHSRIYEQQGRFFLEDLKSSNGTFYANAAIKKPVELKHGDRFQLGETYIEVEVIYQEVIASADTPQFPKINAFADEAISEENSFYDTSSLNNVELPLEPSTLTLNEETIVIRDDKFSEFLRGKYELQSTIKVPSQKVFMAQAPDAEDAEFKMPELSLPAPLRRSAAAYTGDEITERYKIIDKIGESIATEILRVHDRQTGRQVFILYTKEAMLVKTFSAKHPHLLIADFQGEYQERKFLVFASPDICEPLPPQPLTEIKILQAGIMLVDILLYLHESGINGFDISPSHIFYGHDELPKFALFPAIIYEKMTEEQADVFSLGTMLLELAIGQSIPYTPFGTLDIEKVAPGLKRLSKGLSTLILEILDNNETNLEKIGEKLKNILSRLLAPKACTREGITIQILRMGNSLVYSFGEGFSCSLPWKKEIAERALDRLINGEDPQELIQVGKDIYQSFWPMEIQKTLAEIDVQHVCLAIDHSLLSVPWEIGFQENQFLFSKFCFSRKTLPIGPQPVVTKIIPSPRIFILASGESWAQKVKHFLVDNLSDSFPRIKVRTANTADNPYYILQQIASSDILHILGAVSYQQENSMNSGWRLTGKNILKIRFLENAPRKPKVIFNQAEINPANAAARFAALLYKAEIPVTISTLWPITDGELPLVFYQNLLRGLPVDFALQQAQEKFTAQIRFALAPIIYGEARKALFKHK